MKPVSSFHPLPARRALFAPGLLALLTPSMFAKTTKPDVTITVGGLFSLTGNSSDLGTQCKLMMTIAAGDLDPLLRDYNSNPPAKDLGVAFDLLIEDTQLDPAKAAAGAQNLINQGAQFLIGPQTSSEVAQVKPITDAAGIVLISPGSTASTLSIPNDSVFRFVPDDTLESKAIAQVAANDGIKAICPVWRDDAGNAGLANSLKNFGPGLGITVLDGFKYPTSGADFATLAANLNTTVQNLKLTYSLSQIGIFLAAFDQGADLLTAASLYSDLASIKWYAGDGVTLSSAYLAPGPAQFAASTRLIAPSLGLPADARLLRNPVLAQMQAAGVSQPIPFSYAAYDGFVCATLAWLLAGGNKTKVAELLPQIARMHYGTTGWALLNANGDRAIGDFEFFGIVFQNGAWQWTSVLLQQVSS